MSKRIRNQCGRRGERIFSNICVLPSLAVVLSLVLAMILERNIPGKSLFRTFFLSPLMVPTASVVLVWQVLFHNHGTVNQIIEHFGGTTFDWLKSDYGQSRSAGCAAAILEHFYRRGIDIFADYKYYPNQVVYHKIFDALSIISNNAM